MKNSQTPTYVREHNFNGRKINESVFVTDRLGNPIHFGDSLTTIYGSMKLNNRVDNVVRYQIPNNYVLSPCVFIDTFFITDGERSETKPLSNYPIPISKTLWIKKKNLSIFERIRVFAIYHLYYSIGFYCRFF